jgi:hypothetical protein
MLEHQLPAFEFGGRPKQEDHQATSIGPVDSEQLSYHGVTA